MLALGVFPDVSLKCAREKRDAARQLLAEASTQARNAKPTPLDNFGCPVLPIPSVLRTALQIMGFDDFQNLQVGVIEVLATRTAPQAHPVAIRRAQFMGSAWLHYVTRYPSLPAR